MVRNSSLPLEGDPQFGGGDDERKPGSCPPFCRFSHAAQSPAAGLLEEASRLRVVLLLLLLLAGLGLAGEFGIAVPGLVDGGQRGLLAETLAQAHQQWLRHGRDVHVVAQVDPSQGRELSRVLHGVGQLLRDGPGQSVPVEREVGEAGQPPQEGQQEAQQVVGQIGEAQIQRVQLVTVALKVVGQAVNVPRGQGDPRQVQRVLALLLLQAALQAKRKRGGDTEGLDRGLEEPAQPIPLVRS